MSNRHWPTAKDKRLAQLGRLARAEGFSPDKVTYRDKMKNILLLLFLKGDIDKDILMAMLGSKNIEEVKKEPSPDSDWFGGGINGTDGDGSTAG